VFDGALRNQDQRLQFRGGRRAITERERLHASSQSVDGAAASRKSDVRIGRGTIGKRERLYTSIQCVYRVGGFRERRTRNGSRCIVAVVD